MMNNTLIYAILLTTENACMLASKGHLVSQYTLFAAIGFFSRILCLIRDKIGR
jgi:hypothetical protein